MSQKIPSTGVPSPYALAEQVARRRIDWAKVENRPALLEEILQTPYEDLFDPVHGSPLYLGMQLKEDGSIERRRPQLPDDPNGDLRTSADSPAVANLAQLVEAIGAKQLADVPVRALAASRGGRIILELGETPSARETRLARIFNKDLLDTLFPIAPGYHPPGMSWSDAGRFYNEAAEFFDPIQGAVGDCYLISALSSVAWARPFTILDAARATGGDNESFKHRITFYEGAAAHNFEVTDKILVSDGGSIPYCRSSESGEIWPGIYEKAYARMRLDESSDYPAIPNIAGGDPVGACAQLTGLSPSYLWHSGCTAADVLSAVRSHSNHGRTTSPMVAWTYGSGAQADIAYRDANIVACHAYSVLGSMRRYEFRLRDLSDLRPHLPPQVVPEVNPPGPQPGPYLQLGGSGLESRRFAEASLLDKIAIKGAVPVDYLIVRNPWGYFEGNGPSTTSGSHLARDVDWWRSIPLGSNGVFAIEVGAFHRYFAGIGYVS